MAYQGSPEAAPDPARTSRAISVAVSKPRPKSSPSGYICHGLVIDFMTRPSRRFMNPRLFSCSSSAASS